jgi:hypothetical protein
MPDVVIKPMGSMWAKVYAALSVLTNVAVLLRRTGASLFLAAMHDGGLFPSQCITPVSSKLRLKSYQGDISISDVMCLPRLLIARQFPTAFTTASNRPKKEAERDRER